MAGSDHNCDISPHNQWDATYAADWGEASEARGILILCITSATSARARASS